MKNDNKFDEVLMRWQESRKQADKTMDDAKQAAQKCLDISIELVGLICTNCGKALDLEGEDEDCEQCFECREDMAMDEKRRTRNGESA